MTAKKSNNTKVHMYMTLTIHSRSKQQDEPEPQLSLAITCNFFKRWMGKIMHASCYPKWFWFCLLLVEKLAQEFAEYQVCFCLLVSFITLREAWNFGNILGNNNYYK